MQHDGTRPPNRLKDRLAEGKVCIGATVTMNSPVVAEILAHMDGLDWIWFEMEHSSLSEQDVLTMLQTTNGSDVNTVVRVPWNDKTMIKRVLDLGPDGIIIPLVNSKAEAEAAIKAIKYPPWGERGAGLARAQAYGLHMAEYLKTANQEVAAIMMIEHIDAVNNIDEILSVKGVDSIMVGALARSGSMGLLGQTDDERVEAAVQKVLAAAGRAGVPCGIITVSPEQTNERIRQGFTNLIAGIDVLFFHGAVRDCLGRLTPARG